MRVPAMGATLVLFAGAMASAGEVRGQFDKTVQVAGPAELDIVSDSGGISVQPGSAGRVVIHAVLEANDRSGGAEGRVRALEQDPPVEQNGNSVRIGYVRDRRLLRAVSIRFEILTPPDSSVRAHADSGGIRVEGLQGPVDCTADSGGIEITGIGSEVRAKADSGGIRVRDVRGALAAHADSGGVTATGIAGPLEISTDSGGVDVEQTVPAPVHVRADSGRAQVRLAPAGGYDVTLRSDSGRITVPELMVGGAISRHHVEGKLRGGGPLVDVRVDSGSLTIE